MKELNAHEALEAFVGQFETAAAASRALNISQPYLNDLLRGRRDVGPKVLAKLGLKRVVVKDTSKLERTA